MVRYLTLLTFTQQGLDQIKQSPQRGREFAKSVEAAGGRVVAQYWSLGEFDGCVVFEAPDAATGAALLLQLGKLGNVRTRSLQVFDESEVGTIVNSL